MLSAPDQEGVPVTGMQVALYSHVCLYFAPCFPGTPTQGHRHVAFGQVTCASKLEFGQGAASYLALDSIHAMPILNFNSS